MVIHCLESEWIGKNAPLGNLHPSAFEITPRLRPWPISRASGCKLPQGANFPIHPSFRQCIITIHSRSGKNNVNTLPPFGMNWKIHPPPPPDLKICLSRDFAPLDPWDCPRGAKSLLRLISWSSGGRIFQYIPPLGSVLLQYFPLSANFWGETSSTFSFFETC